MISKELQKRILSSIILIPTVIFFILKGSFFFIFFLGVFFLFASYEWIKMSKNQFKFIGILYLLFCSYSALILRDRGADFLFFVILICISTDIGGYIFGKLFKGPKLIKISPNKTYAGMVGSFVLSIIAGLVFTYIVHNFNLSDLHPQYFGKGLYINLNDFVISYFKRLAKIKNTGNIIPGHGGLLDRVDGIIFAIPIAVIFDNFSDCYIFKLLCPGSGLLDFVLINF